MILLSYTLTMTDILCCDFQVDSLKNTQATLSLLGTPLAVLKAQIEEEVKVTSIVNVRNKSSVYISDSLFSLCFSVIKS